MSRLKLSAGFGDKCKDRIIGTFSRLGLTVPVFEPRIGELPYLAGEFVHAGRKYRIEIYDKNVVMHEGPHYYECYMREEWKSEEGLVSGFVARLERLLSGGTWQGPEEKRTWDRVVAFVKESIGRPSN